MPSTLAASTVDVGGAVSDMLRSVLLFLPKLLLFLAILVIGWLVARLLRRVVNRLLERVGFDRWVERGGVKKALATSRFDASDIVAKLVYYTVLLFTLQLAFGVWGPNPVSDLIDDIVAWLPNLLIAIVIVVIASAIASAVRNLIGTALGGLSYGRLLANLASVFIVGVGVIAALNQIGVATTVTTPILIAVLATLAGILVVGVGGGLIRPMQQRWEGWLGRAEQESAAIAEHARAYAADQRTAAEQAAREASERASEQTAQQANEQARQPAAGSTALPVAVTPPPPAPVTYAPGIARSGTYPAPQPPPVAPPPAPAPGQVQPSVPQQGSPQDSTQSLPQGQQRGSRRPQPPPTTVPDQPPVGSNQPTMIVPKVPPADDE